MNAGGLAGTRPRCRQSRWTLGSRCGPDSWVEEKSEEGQQEKVEGLSVEGKGMKYRGVVFNPEKFKHLFPRHKKKPNTWVY